VGPIQNPRKGKSSTDREHNEGRQLTGRRFALSESGSFV
jgi:hypothetical protein